MNKLYILTVLGCLFGVVSATGFQGQIIDIPKQIHELYHEKNIVMVNGENYPARIKVDLYNLKSDENAAALVQSDYSFKFKDLHSGDYELVVNSYDFELSSNRYRIIINDQSIYAYEDGIGESSYNKTSQVDITREPLIIRFKTHKQFYDNPQSSIGDWFLNGPFGFIFRNKTYTIIFTVMMGLSLAPYILKWVSPEFAKEFQELQVQATKERLEKVSPAPVTEKSTSQGNIRKRK
ncbi:hypothetical protein JA1_002136 [Spathaspora sp. JA1]|nr:hypothetical protein JA1_002136 [Spathaspora sp. JA1]